jgi:hypothetical protein
MRRWTLHALTAGLIATTASWSVASPPAPTPRVSTVTLVIGNRVFPDFTDRQTVKLNQQFQVGDTDYSARIVQYVPDFTMDLKTGKIASRSSEPRNPAFKIIVKQKKVPQDTTWAMLNMPPHFARKSMLAFEIERIDFIGHDPVIRPSNPAHPPQMAPSHPSTRKDAAHPR